MTSVKKLLIVASIFVSFALFAYFARDSVRQTIADWTGEEDPEWQVKGLYYLALSFIQPPRDTADFAPMKYADVNPFGVNVFLEQEVEEAKIRRSLQMIRDAGFHWIRQEFPWEDIEKPGKGQFYDVKYSKPTWDKYDRIVELAQEYGLEIVARLDHPPAWSRREGRARGDFAPPDNFDDYGDFVAAVVARYQGKIHFYQIWNEPNIYPEWGEQDVDANEYVRLLKIGYTRAKAADPRAVIISAGLAQTVAEDGRNLNDRLFLQQMYDAGARGYFDILAVQDYGLFSGPGDRRLDEEDRINFSRPIQLREIMVKNGDAGTPIWAMEIGWNVLPAEFADAPYGRVNESRQARYAWLAYDRAENEWPWMGGMMYWFFRRVDDREKNQPFYYFRMVEPDFRALPVYAAMQDYIPRARWVGIGFHSAGHWAMDWRGSWETRVDPTAYFDEYRIGRLGDSVSFVFRGTDLNLVVKQNPYGGAVRVQVDDAPPREIELWRTDAGVGGRIALARDLDDGMHRAMITVTRAPVAVNGFVVQRGNAWWERRVLIVVSSVSLAVAGIVWRRKRTRTQRIQTNR
ncbi:MAG: cellulase family glycosylhydrolase [Chloroflexi bacterium]|nr:cellulase family glycosylhydrolase [Chloroflexota bacterium]